MAKNSYKKKYLSLFYATFGLVLGIVCLIIVIISNVNIHSYINRKNESVNAAITSTLNSTLREIERTVLQTSQFDYVDTLLASETVKDMDLYSAKEFMLKMTQLRSFNSTISSIELFCTSNDIIVSGSVYSLEELEHLNPLQYEYYCNLKQNRSSYYTPQTQTRLNTAYETVKQQVLTTVCYFERGRSNFFIIVNIDPTNLAESIEESYSDDISFAIYKDGAEVMGTISNAAQFASYANSQSSSTKKVTYKNARYYLLSSSLKHADMRYVWLMPTSSWHGKNRVLTVTIYIGLFFLALISSYYISRFLSSKIFQPIDELTRYVEDIRGNDGSSSNEFVFIKNAFESFQTEIASTQAQISEFLPMIRTHLLRELVQSGTNDLLLDQLSKYNISFPHPYLRIILLQYESAEEEGDLVTAEQIYMAIMSLQRLKNKNTDKIQSQVFEQSEQKICIIFNYDHSDLYSDAYFCEIGPTLKETLYKISSCPITVSIGRAVTTLSQLPLSYKSAQNVLDNRYAFGKGNTLPYSCISKGNEKNRTYLKIQEQEVMEAIRKCDTEAIIASIEEIRDSLTVLGDWKVIQITVVSLLFSMIHNFTKNGNIEDFFLEEIFKASSWEKILSMDINELISHLEKVALAIVNYTQCNLNEKREKIVDDAKLYIGAHYCENISISDIADAINVSAGHLSRTFRIVSGTTVIDYLTNYRIEQAKLLLEDMDLKVKEIAQRVGYYQTQSFIRVFKTKVGQTPGQYREMLSQKQRDGQ